MKRSDSADPVLPIITVDLPPVTFVPLYIRHQDRASPERLVLRHRPSTARRPPSDSAGQGARVHRVEAGIVDEAGRRTVRPVVLSSTVAREECIYRPPQRRATSCEEPDEEPMLFPTDLQTYPGRTYPEFSTPIRIHENLEAQHLVNAMAVLGCHCGKRLRHEPGVIP